MTKRIIPFSGDLDATGDPKAIVSHLIKLKQEADSARKPYEDQWIQNLGFYAGNHYGAYCEDARRLGTTGRKINLLPDSSKTRLIINQIYSICEQKGAYILNNLPAMLAVPATPDPADVEAAEVGTDILQARFYDDNEPRERDFDLKWLFGCGDILRFRWWDTAKTYKGVLGDIPGDISLKRFHPFRFYFAPQFDCTEESPWVVLSESRDVDEINDLFPGHEVKEEKVADSMRNFDRLLSNVVMQSSQSTEKRGAAILNWMFVRPNSGNPKGKLFVWAGNKLLHQGDLPGGIYPITRFSWSSLPGLTYALPFIQPLISLQKDLNFTYSAFSDAVKRQLRGDILVEGEGKITQEKQYDEQDRPTGAKVIRVGSGSAHAQFLTYNMSTANGKDRMVMVQDALMDLSGQHDGSAGRQVSSNQPVGTTLALQQADTTGTSSHRDSLAEAYCRDGEIVLKMSRENIKMPRPVVSRDGKGDPKDPIMFIGSDLRSTELVRVRPTPMVSELIKSQQFAAYYQQGLFAEGSGPEKLLRDAEFVLRQGLPEIESWVEAQIAGHTVEELREIVAEIHKNNAEAALLLSEANAAQAAQTAAMANQPPVQPAQDPNQPMAAGGVPNGAMQGQT